MCDLISVVVPVYNTGLYLEKCIKSITQQDYPNIEIIMVDDGSTDDETIKKCDELVKQNSIVHLFRKTNGGSASARNFGIKHAQGQYIGFVDSDDVIDVSMYSSLYSLIKNDKVSVAICGISTEQSGQVTLNDEKLASGCFNHHDLMHHFLLGHWHSACTCLYEKSSFDNTLFPEGEVNEDYILNYHIFKKIPKISFINEPFYHYIRREDSNTGAPKTLRFLDWIKHTQLVLDELQSDVTLKEEAEYQYLYSNIVLANSALLTLNRVKSTDATKLYDITTSNIRLSRKMLLRNHFFSTRNKLMGICMACFAGLYKICVLNLLKIKRVL